MNNNTNYNYRGPTAPSAPTMYLDLLSDDDVTYSYPTTTTTTTTNANVVTPTADAVYMSYSPTVQANVPCSSTQPAITAAANTDKAVVMIPSNSVFIEQPHVPPSTTPSTSTLSNVNNHGMTTTTSPFAYNNNNNNNSNNGSNYYHHREVVDESDRRRRPWESSPYETSPNSENSYNNYHSNDRDMPIAILQQQQEQQQDQPQQQRYFNGKPVKAKHAHLPDSVLAFKADRKRRTVMATCTGGAVGLIALAPVMGPFGAVIGATSAYAAAKSVGKHRERKLTEHAMLQQNYQSSSVHYNHHHHDDDDIPNEGEEGEYGASSAPSTNETTNGRIGQGPSSIGTRYAIDRAEMA